MDAPAPDPGARNPLRLIAWYGHHESAPAGDSPLDRFCHGAGKVVWAVRRLGSDRALLRAALVPTLLSLTGAAVIAGLSVLPDWSDDGWRALLRHFAAVFVTLASLPPTLLHPFWVGLAKAARGAVGLGPGHDEQGGGYVRTVIAESAKGLRQAVVGGSLGLLPLLIVLAVMPGDWLLKPVALAAWALYWIVIDAFELPFELSGAPDSERSPWFARWLIEWADAKRWWSLRLAGKIGRMLHRLARPWHREIAFTERHAAGCAGFGAAIGVLIAIPVVGLFFRAVAIIAATSYAAGDPAFGQVAPPRAELVPDPELQG